RTRQHSVEEDLRCDQKERLRRLADHRGLRPGAEGSRRGDKGLARLRRKPGSRLPGGFSAHQEPLEEGGTVVAASSVTLTRSGQDTDLPPLIRHLLAKYPAFTVAAVSRSPPGRYLAHISSAKGFLH